VGFFANLAERSFDGIRVVELSPLDLVRRRCVEKRHVAIERAWQAERDLLMPNTAAPSWRDNKPSRSWLKRSAIVMPLSLRVGGLLKQLDGRRTGTPNAGGGPDGAGSDWIGLF